MGKIDFGIAPEYMTGGQRFASCRSDVLVYQADVLEKEVTTTGPVKKATQRVFHTRELPSQVTLQVMP